MYDWSSALTTSEGKFTSAQTSGLVIESLNASTACPYFLFSGQPISWYNISMGVFVFSATWRMIEATILPLLKRSSHFTMSSWETRRLERSI